ncbi:hypothetical protein [Actinokineospora sp. NPDC004072]
MRPDRHRTLNRLLAVLALAVFAGVGLVLLLDDDPVPVPQEAPCGEPASTDVDGRPLDLDTARDVAGVHAAACAGDYDALLAFLPDSSRMPMPISPSDIVAGWRRADPAGVKLRAVAAVLERPGVGGQGGLTFCDPDLGLVAFSRGTKDMEPGLGTIEYPSAGRPVDCSQPG